MRNHIAVAICVAVAVIFAMLRYIGEESWYWSIAIPGCIWLFTGTWLAKVNLNRTHSQLVQDRMKGAKHVPSLAKWMMNCGAGLMLIAIVVYFVT